MKNAASRRSNHGLEQAHVEFLYQLLETELGGIEVYRAALQSAVNPDLRTEWQHYLRQTEQHVRQARSVVENVGLDPDVDTPGRQVLRGIAKALVHAIESARGGDDPRAAELVAAECVVHAETKDHANWSMVARLADAHGGTLGRALAAAHAAVEDEEDEHLYHSQGWARELQARSLGLAAELPPPEERRDVRSAIDAARARREAEADQ
jgi:hypothetical protein